MKITKNILSLALCCLTVFTASSREIKADYNDVKGAKSETYFKCVGAGRAAEGLRSDWREHMIDVQENFPFEYLRFHGLLHDDMGVCTYSPDGKKILYNFQYIDELYDFLLSVNIKPFVELSFMPHALASGEKSIFWWKGNVTKPRDYNMWEDLITALVEHLTERYGKEEVTSWYFEVWNEPNLGSFFQGTQDDYFRLYKSTAKAVKGVCEDYRVGGPATAGNAWIEETIDFAQKNNIPLDFITTHAYGVYGALDEFGVQQLRLVQEPNCVVGGVNSSRNRMNKKGFEDVELHYTEWNSSYSPRDLTHDTYLNAAYVLNTLRKSDSAAQSMSYWTFTDVFEESGVPATPLHGGFGLINMQGLRKPTYFAYKYLAQLGNEELVVKNDKDSWVCRDDEGGVQMLTYNLTMPKYGKADFNHIIFGKDYPTQDLKADTFTIDNIPNGEYRLEVYYTGYGRNDIQTLYHKMGSPDQLTRQQEETLRLAALDAPLAMEVVTVSNGEFTYEFDMRENDVCFIKLTPLK